MPIYEYKCLSCDGHFERLQKATDQSLTTCGECGGKLQKQWSLSGFQFKGEGWYVTDYAKKKESNAKDKLEKTTESESTEKAKSASNEKITDTPKKDKVPEKSKDK